jgi:hypothetical protein
MNCLLCGGWINPAASALEARIVFALRACRKSRMIPIRPKLVWEVDVKCTCGNVFHIVDPRVGQTYTFKCEHAHPFAATIEYHQVAPVLPSLIKHYGDLVAERFRVVLWERMWKFMEHQWGEE